MDNNFYGMKLAAYKRLEDRLRIALDAADALKTREATVNPDGDPEVNALIEAIEDLLVRVDGEIDALGPMVKMEARS